MRLTAEDLAASTTPGRWRWRARAVPARSAGAVDAAVSALGEEVVPLSGPDGETYLDLAEPPALPGEDLGSGCCRSSTLWRTVARGARVDVELTPLDGATLPDEDELAAPVAALGRALDLRIADVRLGR